MQQANLCSVHYTCAIEAHESFIGTDFYKTPGGRAGGALTQGTFSHIGRRWLVYTLVNPDTVDAIIDDQLKAQSLEFFISPT